MFASHALHCLVRAYSVFARDRRRAVTDCEAGVWLLAHRLLVSLPWSADWNAAAAAPQTPTDEAQKRAIADPV